MINGIALPGPGQTPQAMYPAITHFTDAITALPREFQRHASLLKEVDSKAWRLEEVLSQQLDSASQTTPFAALVDDYLEESVSAPQDKRSQPSHESILLPFARRKHFSELYSTLTELMVTADEKNHVLWNANNELSKHIYRLETVYQYVQGEVSEDTRLGNKHHWAYWKKPEKPARTSDRPRRETTHAAEAHKDAAASTRRRRTNKDRPEDDESTKGSRRGGESTLAFP
ncbi:hypothetical protein KEM56_005244 [Ascosphaera pollenicola]|nr:hypothetical protein KEM56_005244 [Ascosphaera pollenicola]